MSEVAGLDLLLPFRLLVCSTMDIASPSLSPAASAWCLCRSDPKSAYRSSSLPEEFRPGIGPGFRTGRAAVSMRRDSMRSEPDDVEPPAGSRSWPACCPSRLEPRLYLPFHEVAEAFDVGLIYATCPHPHSSPPPPGLLGLVGNSGVLRLDAQVRSSRELDVGARRPCWCESVMPRPPVFGDDIGLPAREKRAFKTAKQFCRLPARAGRKAFPSPFRLPKSSACAVLCQYARALRIFRLEGVPTRTGLAAAHWRARPRPGCGVLFPSACDRPRRPLEGALTATLVGISTTSSL